jgi:hypothetical protein
MPLPPVDLWTLTLTALLNPVVIAVAFWMGSRASEWQKLPVAAFAAAAVGFAAVYVAVWLGWGGLGSLGRAAAGLFTAQFLFGLVWAAIGYRFGRRAP